MPRKPTDEQFFDALCAALTKHGLWQPGRVEIQLHPFDRQRLHKDAFNKGRFKGCVISRGSRGSLFGEAAGHTELCFQGDRNQMVIIWDGKTVRQNWMGVEVNEKAVKMVNLFPAPPRVKKPKKERLTRFDRDFEV